MSGLFFDVCWLLGGILIGMVLHEGFHAGWWTVTKTQPPAVRVSPLSEDTSQRIHDASKRIVRASLQKGNFQ